MIENYPSLVDLLDGEEHTFTFVRHQGSYQRDIAWTTEAIDHDLELIHEWEEKPKSVVLEEQVRAGLRTREAVTTLIETRERELANLNRIQQELEVWNLPMELEPIRAELRQMVEERLRICSYSLEIQTPIGQFTIEEFRQLEIARLRGRLLYHQQELERAKQSLAQALYRERIYRMAKAELTAKEGANQWKGRSGATPGR